MSRRHVRHDRTRQEHQDVGSRAEAVRTIARLRVDEMNAAAPFRVVSAVTSAIAQVPLLISPVVAFALFGVVASRTGETLDATRLFAALSIIILQAQPLF